MDCKQFLREERERKLAHIQVLMSGNVTITAKIGERPEDVSAEIIRENLRLVSQIEKLLDAEYALND